MRLNCVMLLAAALLAAPAAGAQEERGGGGPQGRTEPWPEHPAERPAGPAESPPLPAPSPEAAPAGGAGARPAPPSPLPAGRAAAAGDATALEPDPVHLAGVEKLLEYAAQALKKDLPAPRREGGNCPPDEVRARLRLAALLLLLDRVEEAHLALEPLGTCEGKAELYRLALAGLAAWSSGLDKSEAAAAFQSLARRAAGGAKLALRGLALADEVRTYGVYTERAARTCAPGEKVFAYCEALNFAVRRTDAGTYLVALDLDLVVEADEVPAAGAAGDAPAAQRRVVWRTSGFQQFRHSPRSEPHDLFMTIWFRVPQDLAPGRYWLKLSAKDVATGQTAESDSIPLDVAR